jgi:hypothetical protein
VATSFFDLVRTGAAPFDAPGFAAEELTELVHAALDLLPPTLAADLAAHGPFEHHGPAASWADLVAGHDHVDEPWGPAHGPFDQHAPDHGPGGLDPFDFGAGASHRLTTFDDVEHHGPHEAHHAPDVHGLHDEHGDHGWAHDDLFEHDLGQPHPLGHDQPLFSDVAGHEHAGLHDSVLHAHGLHDGDHGPHEPGHDLHHDPAHDEPHHDGGWHHE